MIKRVFIQYVLNFSSIALFGIFFLISLWSSSFGFISGFTGLLILIIGMSVKMRRKSKRTLLLTHTIWLFANLVLIVNSINSYDLKRSKYMEKISNNYELAFNEKFNIYALNIFMSLFSLPIYPEVSLESFLLVFPAKNGYRTFNNGFFLKSKKINNAITGSGSDTTYISWKLKDYFLGTKEARYALALNPCRIIKKKIGANDIYEVKVRVEYPMKSEVTLIKYPIELKIEEGLFGYLQKAGWLHPYDAIWIGKR